MKNSAVTKVIQSSADPERARHFFDLLSETGARAALQKLSIQQAHLLASLFSGSQALGNLLIAHPDWLSGLEIEHLRFPRRELGLRNEAQSWLQPLLNGKDYATALGRVREFKQREMLRIGARDLAHLSNVPEITREISDVADICLHAVWHICYKQLTERFGQPWHQDTDGEWQHTEFCVLGMGKLGGQELNYSSDVDVLFVYSDEGQVFKAPPGSAGEPPARLETRQRDAGAPRAIMANHQFFTRLAEAFITEVSRVSGEGMLFRIDLRLRPEGDSGPLCRSLGSYENYYAQWGQTWERMMLIKARHVGGDKGLAAEFLETVQSFRYPRSIGENVLHEIGAMKDRIENEVVRVGELERNVKLGRGGIREVEFIAQSQQLLHAGKMPFLQGAQTLPALDKLAQYKLLFDEESRSLRDAYCFLRNVEHRLQMEENLQTHTIPKSRLTQQRLAKLMKFNSAAEFETARKAHTNRVRAIFDKLFKSEKSSAPAETLPNEFTGAESEWEKLLAEHSFREPDKMVHLLREFAEGPGYVHVSSRTVELARTLLPRLLAMCPRNSGTGVPPVSFRAQSKEPARRVLSDPDRVVTRLDSFIAAYGARSTLFELWNSNPSIFDLLILLFDRSEFLAELAIRTPDMVDVLVTSGRLRQRKTSEETLRDLRHGLNDADQKLWLRRYHQTELMRIGLRDILGLADPEQYLTELSALADACLQYAVEATIRKHKIKNAPFVIIGLGKLGGAEIDYGSDLDILFVAETPAKNLVKLGKLALEVMDLLSARTDLGIVFRTDARLRPDGEKGLLVNTLAAYEEYYRERAQLWEIQSLTRTRTVAGDPKLGVKFQQLTAALTNFSKPVKASMLSRVDWKSKIHDMRLRIEKERTPAGKDDLAIKTGKGGLMDAEFIAQTLCLENGWHEANTLRALEQGSRAGVLPGADQLIENYRQLRRVEGILRRWSYEGETVLPDEPEPFYRVSIRCGFAAPVEFRDALIKWRAAVREVYLKVFNPVSKKSKKK